MTPLPFDEAPAEPERLEAVVADAAARHDFEAGAAEIIRGYGPKVYGYLRSVLRDEAAAEDAFALFAENVWRGLSTWERRGTVQAWAYRVAWNAATRQFRDPWQRRRQGMGTSVASRLAAAVMSSSGRALDRHEAELDGLRASLTPEEQSLLVLRIDRGLSWSEVAHALELPEDAPGCAVLRKRFERLKERLAADARARGLLDDE